MIPITNINWNTYYVYCKEKYVVMVFLVISIILLNTYLSICNFIATSNLVIQKKLAFFTTASVDDIKDPS